MKYFMESIYWAKYRINSYRIINGIFKGELDDAGRVRLYISSRTQVILPFIKNIESQNEYLFVYCFNYSNVQFYDYSKSLWQEIPGPRPSKVDVLVKNPRNFASKMQNSYPNS